MAIMGHSATVQKPGLMAARLVQKMGGLQDCRAFKIPGVRKLLVRYVPDQHFTWSRAPG